MACAPQRFLPNKILLAVVYLLGKDTTRPPSSLMDQRDEEKNDHARHTNMISTMMHKMIRDALLYAPPPQAYFPLIKELQQRLYPTNCATRMWKSDSLIWWAKTERNWTPRSREMAGREGGQAQ